MNKDSVRIIEPRSTLNPDSELVQIWKYRELLYMLAWRDYKIKYRQTVIGIAWAILQPVLATTAFVFLFDRFTTNGSTSLSYTLFVYSGLIIWQFFANSVTEASASLVTSNTMVTKIYFPRIIIPLAKILAQCVDLFFSGILLILLAIFTHASVSLTGVIFSIPLVCILLILSASVGTILSAINVRYRDVQYVLPYFIQLGLFVSPVLFSLSNLGRFQWLLFLNPTTGIIETFRSALFRTTFTIQSLYVSCAITVCIFFISLVYFIQSEGAFSDVI